ncbi:MAG TPA: class I SAM-dependent methyltransferase [Acidimicrobiales bacterium]|nr:class I SAM-dependent methyltransferase [Acidimicrobiales bacterium]
MSSNKQWVLEGVPRGAGTALDLGGGVGELGPPLRERGYSYVNVDFDDRGGDLDVRGDAMRLPIRSGAVELVVSSDTLEHFRHPERALAEVERVLTTGGHLVVWVPFLHPFHGTDLFRYTPLGLEVMIADAGLELQRIESPLWAVSVVAQGVLTLAQRLRLGRLERPLEQGAAWVDARLGARRRQAAAFAAAYLVVATKPVPDRDGVDR